MRCPTCRAYGDASCVTLTTGRPTKPHAAREHALAVAAQNRVHAIEREARELRRVSPWGTVREAALRFSLYAIGGLIVGLLLPMVATHDRNTSAYTRSVPMSDDFGAFTTFWGFAIGLALGIVHAVLVILDNRDKRIQNLNRKDTP